MKERIRVFFQDNIVYTSQNIIIIIMSTIAMITIVTGLAGGFIYFLKLIGVTK